MRPNGKPIIREYRGYRVGDLVLTPLNRIAKIIGFRIDSDYCDALYLDAHPRLAEVILQVSTLRRVQ